MKKMNPLTKEDWSFGKIIARILIMPLALACAMLYIMFPIDVLTYALGFSDSLEMPVVAYLLSLPGLCTLPLILFAYLYIPYWRCSMDAVRGDISYRQLKTLLQNEEFFPTEIRGLYVSNHWLKADGVFIPKNFVLGSDADTTFLGGSDLSGRKYWIRLINGRAVRLSIVQHIGIDDIRGVLKSLMPHMVISQKNRDWWNLQKNGKRLRMEWKEYRKSDGDIWRLISSWSDFNGYYAELERQVKDEPVT